MTSRPTRDGWAWLGLVGAVAVLVFTSGRPPLGVLLAGLCGLALLGGAVGSLGLGAVEVGRRLPPGLFAGRPGAGAWVVRNRSRWFPVGALRLSEGDGDAAVVVAWIPAGGEVHAPAAWVFPARGRRNLHAVVIASSFPFGWWTTTRRLGRPAEVVVAPTPRRGAEVRGVEGDGPAGRRPDAAGEFVGLRPWRSGDALHHVHWRTSARVGQPMVIVRAATARAQRVVVVGALRGEAFERELERACGEVLVSAPDDEVGLDLCGALEPPRVGTPWRRHLLDTLALVADRP